MGENLWMETDILIDCSQGLGSDAGTLLSRTVQVCDRGRMVRVARQSL